MTCSHTLRFFWLSRRRKSQLSGLVSLSSPNGRTLKRARPRRYLTVGLRPSFPASASSCVSRRPAKRLVEEMSLKAFGIFQCHWLHAQDAGMLLLLFVIVGHESGASDLGSPLEVRRHCGGGAIEHRHHLENPKFAGKLCASLSRRWSTEQNCETRRCGFGVEGVRVLAHGCAWQSGLG